MWAHKLRVFLDIGLHDSNVSKGAKSYNSVETDGHRKQRRNHNQANVAPFASALRFPVPCECSWSNAKGNAWSRHFLIGPGVYHRHREVCVESS